MTILLVEDDHVLRMVIETSLEDAGFEVIAAESGLDAIESVHRHPGVLTAVVTDLMLPGGMDGVSLVGVLRADYPDIPMVLVTAMPLAIGEEWRHRHSVEVLGKPFSLASLVALLQDRLAAQAASLA